MAVAAAQAVDVRARAPAPATVRCPQAQREANPQLEEDRILVRALALVLAHARALQDAQSHQDRIVMSMAEEEAILVALPHHVQRAQRYDKQSLSPKDSNSSSS